MYSRKLGRGKSCYAHFPGSPPPKKIARLSTCQNKERRRISCFQKISTLPSFSLKRVGHFRKGKKWKNMGERRRRGFADLFRFSMCAYYPPFSPFLLRISIHTQPFSFSAHNGLSHNFCLKEERGEKSFLKNSFFCVPTRKETPLMIPSNPSKFLRLRPIPPKNGVVWGVMLKKTPPLIHSS